MVEKTVVREAAPPQQERSAPTSHWGGGGGGIRQMKHDGRVAVEDVRSVYEAAARDASAADTELLRKLEQETRRFNDAVRSERGVSDASRRMLDALTETTHRMERQDREHVQRLESATERIERMSGLRRPPRPGGQAPSRRQ